MDEFSEEMLAEMFDALWDGMVEVECPVCGHSQTVEPDADYPCPECKQGMLTSPLVVHGLI